MTYFAFLEDRQVLRVSGEDSTEFLQALISNDVRNAGGDRAILAALLSPKGKFLFDFFVVKEREDFLLDTRSDTIDALYKRMMMYKLRSKVDISIDKNLSVAAMWGEGDDWKEELSFNSSVADSSNVICFTDPRTNEMGIRIIATEADIVGRMIKDSADMKLLRGEEGKLAYDRHRLSLAIPEGGKDTVYDRTILREIGYDILNGVSFTKGCYIGQEVTARSKHKAELRKHLFSVSTIREGDMLPAFGSKIFFNGNTDEDGEIEIGEMRSSCGDVGLALIRTDKLQKVIMRSAAEGEESILSNSVLDSIRQELGRVNQSGETVFYADDVAMRLSVPHWAQAK